MAPSFAADLQVPLLSGEAHAPNRSAWLPTRRLLVVLLALGATCMSCAVLIGGRAGTVVLLLGVTILALVMAFPQGIAGALGPRIERLLDRGRGAAPPPRPAAAGSGEGR